MAHTTNILQTSRFIVFERGAKTSPKGPSVWSLYERLHYPPLSRPSDPTSLFVQLLPASDGALSRGCRGIVPPIPSSHGRNAVAPQRLSPLSGYPAEDRA